MNLESELNLELAWRRHARDLKDRCFAESPYESVLIGANLPDWIAELRLQLKDYRPSRSEVINAPKPGFHLRPGAVLVAPDATVYNALLLHGAEKIRQALAWSAENQRCSRTLKEDHTKTEWFVDELYMWKRFRERSLAHLDSGHKFVVFSDVSAYFENVSIGRLISDLRGIGVAEEVLGLLSKCLNRWAEPRARGIPQGFRASFLLGEVYFDSVDRRLANSGLEFCRYVDDIRIFCRSHDKAVEALRLLTTLLREKELNLQTAKSKMATAEAARNEIDGITPKIEKIAAELETELRDIFSTPFEYVTPSLIEKLANAQEKPVELEVVRRAFIELMQRPADQFDKRLFHFCLNRLGAASDPLAAHNRYKIYDLVLERPEELPYVLHYFSKIIPKLRPHYKPLADRLIVNFKAADRISTNDCDRQIYYLLRWIFTEKISSNFIVEFCREVHGAEGIDDYTRDYARAILGEFGDSSDLDALEAEYARVRREASRATILCAIRRMVQDRRNSIYSRAKGDGQLIDYAIAWAKKGGML